MRREPAAIDGLEEAVRLLRSASAGTIAFYVAGAVPLALGILFFVTDMARDAFAEERLTLDSLVVASLLVWKSVWEAFFQERLYSQLSDASSTSGPETDATGNALPAELTLLSGKLLRVILIQTAIQPFSLLAIPVSGLLIVPVPWVTAFFRNVGLFAAIGEPDPVLEARRQAGLWQRQNGAQLSLISLAALILFLNVLMMILLLPQIGRSFLGIEGDFARLGFGLLNTTTVAVACAVTWLLIDPLLDALYVLRCFRGVSIATGEDLRIALKRTSTAAAVLLFLMAVAPCANAQTSSAAEPSLIGEAGKTQMLSPSRLHDSIDEVIHRREFAWRAPRPPAAESPSRWAGWVRNAWKMLDRVAVWIAEKIRAMFPATPAAEKPAAERPRLELWIALAGLCLMGGAVMLYLRRARSPTPTTATATTAAAAVDLRDESVTADQMSENSWLQLARDLLANGDCRLALRALYLAGLNFLAQNELVSINRWKTGRDYRGELERRVKANPAVQANVTPVFVRSVAIFERGWYGRHPVEPADVEALALGLEEMRRYAGRG